MDDKDSSTNQHQTAWTEYQEHSFPLSAPAYYKYYKLKITRCTNEGGNPSSYLHIVKLSIGEYPDVIQKWQDKSGNSNHATQTTAADQPTITTSGMSGKAGLDFDNDKLSILKLIWKGRLVCRRSAGHLSTKYYP